MSLGPSKLFIETFLEEAVELLSGDRAEPGASNLCSASLAPDATSGKVEAPQFCFPEGLSAFDAAFEHRPIPELLNQGPKLDEESREETVHRLALHSVQRLGEGMKKLGVSFRLGML